MLPPKIEPMIVSMIRFMTVHMIARDAKLTISEKIALGVTLPPRTRKLSADAPTIMATATTKQNRLEKRFEACMSV